VKTVILACNTIRDEFEKAAVETVCAHPFRWVESGLHLKPESLKHRLQEELDSITDADRVLLGFGYCGNAVAGLMSRDYELIIPRVDDCISLLLGSRKNREHCARSGGVYFLTKGWLEGEANIWKEYQAVLARFGPERTQRVYRRMLAHYRFLGLIDTGAYDLDMLLPLVTEIAAKLELETRVLPGSDRYIKRLLTGPWDEDEFIILPRQTRIELFHLGFGLPSSAPQIQGVL
jgi:hypothetical protein